MAVVAIDREQALTGVVVSPQAGVHVGARKKMTTGASRVMISPIGQKPTS
jgi:hypothetical protein